MSLQPDCSRPRSLDLLFCCSGAADVAELGDRAVRLLHGDGAGKMFCLSGIGGRVDPILRKTGEADRLIVVDGCELDCARRTVEAAGFAVSGHLRVTSLGFDKGKTPVTAERIDKVVTAVTNLLGA